MRQYSRFWLRAISCPLKGPKYTLDARTALCLGLACGPRGRDSVRHLNYPASFGPNFFGQSESYSLLSSQKVPVTYGSAAGIEQGSRGYHRSSEHLSCSRSMWYVSAYTCVVWAQPKFAQTIPSTSTSSLPLIPFLRRFFDPYEVY